jgi:hypothetical protein
VAPYRISNRVALVVCCSSQTRRIVKHSRSVLTNQVRAELAQVPSLAVAGDDDHYSVRVDYYSSEA